LVFIKVELLVNLIVVSFIISKCLDELSGVWH